MRRKYHMADEQFGALMAASPEERAAVWAWIGADLGFKPETVEAVPGEAAQFTAEDADEIPRPE